MGKLRRASIASHAAWTPFCAWIYVSRSFIVAWIAAGEMLQKC